MAPAADPRAAVAEPVHRALEFHVLRGAASFAVAVLAVVVTVAPFDEPLRTAGLLALPAVLVFVVVARGLHVALRRPISLEDTWRRAHAIERHETELAAFVAIAVPLAWLAGLGAILSRTVATLDAGPAVLAIWLPLSLALWALATIAWAGDCRERLAIALVESDRRFRSYWQTVGRSS